MTKQNIKLALLTKKESVLCATLDELAMLKGTPKRTHKGVIENAFNTLLYYPQNIIYHDGNKANLSKEIEAEHCVLLVKKLLLLVMPMNINKEVVTCCIEWYLSNALQNIQTLLSQQNKPLK